MSSITREELQELATRHAGTVLTDADVLERPDPLPECPSWCWEDHAADARRLWAEAARGLPVSAEDFEPMHFSPWVTFGVGERRPVSIRLMSYPYASDGSGEPMLEVKDGDGHEVEIPLRLAGVIGSYLSAMASD